MEKKNIEVWIGKEIEGFKFDVTNSVIAYNKKWILM
jgi:hypothetical protein